MDEAFRRRSVKELNRIVANMLKAKVAEMHRAHDMMERIERAGPGDGQCNDTIRVCREVR